MKPKYQYKVHLFGGILRTICGRNLDEIAIENVVLTMKDAVNTEKEICKTCEKYMNEFQDNYH